MSILAAIVICANTVPIQACNEDVADTVLFGPSVYQQQFQCQFEAQAYAAEQGLVQPGQIVKIYCGPKDQIRARFGTI